MVHLVPGQPCDYHSLRHSSGSIVHCELRSVRTYGNERDAVADHLVTAEQLTQAPDVLLGHLQRLELAQFAAGV